MDKICVHYIGGDPTIQDFLQKLNSELGWKTRTFSPQNDGEEFLNLEPDLCLVDLDEALPQVLVETVFSYNETIKVFLTSSKEEIAYSSHREAFPFSYLIKPFPYIQLRATAELAIVSLASVKNTNIVLQSWQDEKELQSTFFIKNHNKLLKVKQSDILSVIADGNYCVIITPQRRHAVKISLRRIKTKLSAVLFKQIHRNYIIQVPKVESVDLSSNEVFIDGEAYPIGGSYRQSFLETLDRI